MTLPPQTNNGQRECALYRFWVLHPETGQRVLGYIGETARMPFQRLMEHIYQQPWADTIVAWEVDSTVYPSKAAVLAAERAAILAERPLYNIEGNRGNPDRVPPWTAVEHRQRREPGWQPPVKGVPRIPRQRAPRPARRPARAAARSSWLARWWVRWRVTVCVWVGLWLVLWVAVWWAGRDAWSGWREPRNAAVMASVALSALLWVFVRVTGRVRRARSRRTRKRARR